MIPHTYPTFNDARGAAYMEVFFLPSVTGLTRWVDYIPVKTVAFSVANEGTTNTGGHMTVVQVASSTALQRWVDYIPVFEDAAATIPWDSGSSGYIPVCQALMLDFMFPVLDSRITFTRADATSCATYFGNDGMLKTAAANVARFDYDPATPAGTVGGELAPALTAANWSSAGGWTFDGAGNLVISGASAFSFISSNANMLAIGKTYKISFTVSNFSGSSVYIGPSGRQGVVQVLASGNGTWTGSVKVDSTGIGLVFQVGSSFSGTISNLTVQEVTFAPRGLLIEEQRTNLLLHSRDMTQAAQWAPTNASAAKNAVGLDGVANSACTVTTTNTAHTFRQVFACTASTQYTFSFYAKRGTMTDMKYAVYDNTGAALIIPATSYYSQTNASTFSRVTVAFTTPVGCVSCAVYLLLDSGVSGTAIFDCAQLEVGSFATSVITTGAATVTRAADSASMTGTNFSSWYNQTAGTFVAEASAPYTVPAGSFPQIAVVGNGSNSSMKFGYLTSAAASLEVQVVGVSQAGLYPAIATQNRKIAGAYALNDFAICAAGGAVSTDTSGTIPTVDRASIGSDIGGAIQHINGHIRRLTYYPTRLANATLQALTL